jgi:multisubunit Na+/H+ antiporter MnhC subunit
METNVIYIIGGILALLIFVFIAKRLLRLAIKMTLVGIVIIALLLGAGYGWWNGWFDSAPKTQRRPGPSRTASPH